MARNIVLDVDKIAEEIQRIGWKLIMGNTKEYIAAITGVFLLSDEDYFVFFHHNGNIYRIPKNGNPRIDINRSSDKYTMWTDILDIRHSASVAQITGSDGSMSDIAIQKLCNKLKKGDNKWQTCSRDTD